LPKTTGNRVPWVVLNPCPRVRSRAARVQDNPWHPNRVPSVVRKTLIDLPPTAQQVLAAAAVIGAVVDIDLLRDVLPEFGETDVLDAIDVLLPRRVFRETGNPQESREKSAGRRPIDVRNTGRGRP
jgi:predicted ATPase